VNGGALTGYRVLDFTRILSGPYATMLLADLGAEVIKIERRAGGDETRQWGPPFIGESSAYFRAINRGKRSLALDLAHPGGRALVERLVETADVVVENFRPGVTRRLGIDYDSLARRKPDLVYASINGFGSTGPLAGAAGTEVIVEARSGLMSITGSPDGPPVRFGVAMVDIATGLAAVGGILAALLARSATGRGEYLEFPLYTTALSALGTIVTSATVDPSVQGQRWGGGHASIVPYTVFEAADGFLVLGAINEPMWRRLCEALGLEELLADPRVATNELRVASRELVEAKLAAAIRSRPRAETVEKLAAHNVLVAPIETVLQAVEDEQTRHLDLIFHEDGIAFARTMYAAIGVGTLPPAPRLGEHSRDVLVEALGLDEAAVAALIQENVIDVAGEGAVSVRP
jgi:crotonobetainyl-CoA:carnitine CoA-transferase CaiB-like acyl-CoA transferase